MKQSLFHNICNNHSIEFPIFQLFPQNGLNLNKINNLRTPKQKCYRKQSLKVVMYLLATNIKLKC